MTHNFQLGDKTKKRLKCYLEALGFIVVDTGVENWLAKSFHDLIRYIHNNITVDLIRYFPDLAIFKNNCLSLLEVKGTTEKHYDSPNFSIEVGSWENAVRLDRTGVRVFIVWENRENEFYLKRASKVKPFKIMSPEESSSFNGSRTPTALVAKISIDKIDVKKLTDCIEKEIPSNENLLLWLKDGG